MKVAILVGAAWGALAGTWFWCQATAAGALSHRPLPAAFSEWTAGNATSRAARSRVGLGAAGRAILARVGGPIRRRVLRDAHPEADPVLGAGAIAGLLIALVAHPVLGTVPVAAALAWPPLNARRTARQRTAAVVDQLPDLIDLLRLTTLAGLPVSAAIVAIDSRPGGAAGHGLHLASQQLQHGASTGTVLESLASSCGPPIRPLVDALVDHDRYGTPLGPALDRAGMESRMRRRRQAEEAARRLPVTLLFPLVLTTLPACVLLTVVPLVASSLSALQP